MKVVIQRVTQASVAVEGSTIASIQNGLCILLGLSKEDTEEDADYIIKKILSIRLFSDCDKQWQKNVVEMDYEILLLSQFTLQAVTKNGSKPDFHNAMQTEASRVEFARIAQVLREKYSEERVKTGRFQTVCSVSLINDGPTTIVIDSKQK